jgi:hypothetical protein
MRLLILFAILITFADFIVAQDASDSLVEMPNHINADDPSQFLSRLEVYNELQYRNEYDFYLDQTIIRFVLKIGKRFTSRVDLPYVYNTFTSAENPQQSGIGDVSFRLLGYKIIENPKSALTVSMEISMNTAQSPILGTGKNLFIPMVTYTQLIPKQKMLLAVAFQQANSFSGDAARRDISFSKLQLFILNRWSQRAWTVLQPEWYFDYVQGGVSMNLRSRLTYAPKPRINIWITPSVGIFGEYIARYQWSADIGVRYYLLRK